MPEINNSLKDIKQENSVNENNIISKTELLKEISSEFAIVCKEIFKDYEI